MKTGSKLLFIYLQLLCQALYLALPSFLHSQQENFLHQDKLQPKSLSNISSTEIKTIVFVTYLQFLKGWIKKPIVQK